MKKTSKFQIIFLLVLIGFIIAGVVAFATYKGNKSNQQLPAIMVWGTFPKSAFDQYVTQVNYTQPQPLNIKYVQESSDTFNQDFISALARGQGPDAILIPADLLLPNEDKLTPIPYSILPQRTFINSYIDESSVYLSDNGIYGIPFLADPLVMYWNRDMFNAAGIVMCPDPSCTVYWDEFTGFNQKLTQKQDNGTISQSAIALGDFTNVANAREIFAALMFQIGNPITARTQGSVLSTLRTGGTGDPTPAVQFFTQFVDPNNANYSWNRSWPNSKTAFLSGNLATYFGLSSELSDLRAKNPNLNFDVAQLPQVRTGGVKSIYAKLFGFSIVRASQNSNEAYQVISILTSPTNLAKVSASVYLPSASRAVIAAGSADPYMQIFDNSVLVAKTWLDSNPAQSRSIFADLVQSVTSGQKSVSSAINDAGYQYNAALQQIVSFSSLPPASYLTAALANSDVPDVNLSQSPTGNTPFGAFKLVICDGPEGAGHVDPATGKVDPSKNPNGSYVYPLQNGYRVCDFKGLMIQAQYLINVMITVGILAALVTLSYAGFLYIGGTQKGIGDAKKMFPKIVWGFVFMLTAWFIVSQLLIWLTGTNSYLHN